MERVSRHQVLMQMAEVVAKRGTCSRLQVGVVFARDGRVISTGYNGAPAGTTHCHHQSWQFTSIDNPPPDWVNRVYLEIKPHQSDLSITQGVWYTDGMTSVFKLGGEEPPGCTIAEHAERNAIAFAARHGVALEGTEMYVTHMPCVDCAKSIINAGITRVIYKHHYRSFQGVDLLASVGIPVVDLSNA